MEESFPRIHTLVVGPGLGRNENVMKAVVEIVNEAKSKDTQCVGYHHVFRLFFMCSIDW
jgi:NAD(P)H-hydrate repair Nnr-like enzyme with NAD(P)H-hydrate dehydratase domain